MIRIKEPIWATRSIGLAEHRLEDVTEVEILYKDNHGNRTYPHIYTITKREALGYPVSTAQGTRLRIVPLHALKIQRPKTGSFGERYGTKEMKPIMKEELT